MMNSLCDCTSLLEDGLFCICYDSEEEEDEESDQEILDESIHGDGTETKSESVGFADATFPVPQSCSSTATKENVDTLITKEFEVFNIMDSEHENKDLADFETVKRRTGDHEYGGELFIGKLWDFKNNSGAQETFPQHSSTTLMSAEVRDPYMQKSWTLGNDITLDNCKPLNYGSMPDEDKKDMMEQKTSTTMMEQKTSTAMMEQKTSTAPSHTTEYEWQFQETDGNWISYDKIEALHGIKFTKINITVSQSIEKYCKNNPTPVPMVFRKNDHRCELDLQTMTEHDVDVGIQRPIRRVPKPTPEPKQDKTTLTGDQGTKLMYLAYYLPTPMHRTPEFDRISRIPKIFNRKSGV